MKRNWPLIEDFNVFLTVVRNNSFSRAAIELGVSNAYITKRIGILEDVLGVKLFYRNTRDIKLTESGEVTRVQAEELINKTESALEQIKDVKNDIVGSIHICSSFGFGKNHLAKALSLFSKENPKLKIKLTLTDIKIDLVKEGVDLEVIVGDEFHDRYYAKKIAENKRILCASPGYLNVREIPQTAEALSGHDCLFLQEKGLPFGLWHLTDGHRTETVRVRGDLSSNSGEVILQWALDGHGIALRSQWDARKYIEAGELTQILPDYYERASVWAIYPGKLEESIKTKKCVAFLEDYFGNATL